MLPDDLGIQDLTKLYEMFKTELGNLMNDVQHEVGDEKTKQREIQVIQKITLALIQYRNLKKNVLDLKIKYKSENFCGFLSLDIGNS